MTILAAALASVASSAAIQKRAPGSVTLETSGVEGVVYGQLIYAKSELISSDLLVCFCGI